MADNDTSERPDGSEEADAPPMRRTNAQVNHHGGRENAERKGAPESSDDARNLLEERHMFHFLRSSTPGHVNAKEMTEERLRNMERNTT